MPTSEELSRAMNPAAPAASPSGAPDFKALLAAMMQQQQQQPNLAVLAQMLNAPRGHHYGIGGGEISDANPLGNAGGDPFANGFFQRSAGPDPSAILGGSSPQQIAQFNGVGPQAMPSPLHPPVLFGQGMLNPQLPDASKYQDANFWTASPNVTPSGWMPGMTIRDEKSQYAGAPKRPAKGKFSASLPTRPAFSF